VSVDRGPLEQSLLLAVRCFAGIRLGFMGVALVTHESLGRQPIQPDHFTEILAVGTLYSLTLVGLAIRRPESLLHWRRLGPLDLILLGGLVLYCGGPHSPLRFAYFVIPFLVAFVARPGRAVLWSLATLLSLGLVAVGFAVLGPARAPGVTTAEIAELAFASLGAAAFSAVLVRLDDAVREHARRASALAAAIVRVEARERRTLADALHDGAVQQIAAASREVGSALRGDPARLEDARAALDLALDQLRGEIFDLYPHVLDHAGLDGAVAELARRAADRGGFDTRLEIDPAATGIDDVTVMAVLRELLTNAAKHADADEVVVRVSNQSGTHLLVEVNDDGRGFQPPTPEQAVAERQFGLHSSGDRLRALGGSLDVLSAPGTGTRAIARIPI
jgi:two-component system, NarL family, sensor kinase